MLVYDPTELKGKWRTRAVSGPAIGCDDCHCSRVMLEIGCGKGSFIAGMAEHSPGTLFIAVEGNRSVLLRALEKVKEKKLRNVLFVPEFVEDLGEWFDNGEVDGIFLNFSDPWPKQQNAKRRLTHRNKLGQYFEILGRDGTVTFKTDNDGLFDFTVNEIRAADLSIIETTRDLHAGECRGHDVMTEYESKFSSKGMKINRVVIGRKDTGSAKTTGSMAAENGRTIPKEDRIFGISNRAKKAIAENGRDAVVNATIGALLDDNGDLIVLSSVDKAFRSLSPAEYAEYAPIAGTPGFRAAITKAAFGSFEPKCNVGVVATPGGTGSIRNAISNYSCPGDRVLTHDWHWTPYATVAGEQGRGLETFEMFDEKGAFGLFDFEYKVKKLLRNQDRLVIILNTPANNPTGYSLSEEDWKGVVDVLNSVDVDKKVALVVDIAYIDFAGEEDETRKFYPILEGLNANILPIIAYSASKTFTFYGMRCAAMICMAKEKTIADEFERVNTFSARASWSNSPRGPQTVIDKIHSDPVLLAEVDSERKGFRDMLLARGRAFEEEAAKVGLITVPFRAGFFISVPCDDPETVSRGLEGKNVFLVPMSKGLRISVASISESKCRKLPRMILDAMNE